MDATKLDFLKKNKNKKFTLIIVSEIHVWLCNTEVL